MYKSASSALAPARAGHATWFRCLCVVGLLVRALGRVLGGLSAARRGDLCSPTHSCFCQTGLDLKQPQPDHHQPPPLPPPLNPGPASPSGPQNLDIEALTLAFKQGHGKSSRQSEKPSLGSRIPAGSTTGASRAAC